MQALYVKDNQTILGQAQSFLKIEFSKDDSKFFKIIMCKIKVRTYLHITKIKQISLFHRFAVKVGDKFNPTN